MDRTERNKWLRAAFNERRALLAPGAANALTARIAEDLGFETVYVTGAGIANTGFGVPDIGLTTVTEVASVLSAISDCCTLPLIVDGDTGFGNSLNVIRTVRLLERAGASAIQLEDQTFPKKCGHFSGKGIIPQSEMINKIKAAVDTRESPDLQIIARTDAAATDGIIEAMDRAAAFAEAGADVTFVEAPLNVEDMRRIARELPVPQVVNLVVGGKTPILSQTELQDMGFAVVLYANAALQASIMAIRDVLGSLRSAGVIERAEERLASFEDRQATVRKPNWDQLELRYKES